ncbi:MAG: BON domain-containing protein [Burkholderiales bacterium]|nr:BON domain-containing protein [Burkholderiales bacterium]
MKPDYKKPDCRSVCAAAAAVLVLSLGACGDKPAAPAASAQPGSAADAAVQQAAAAEKKKAEETARAANPAQRAAEAKEAADRALAAKTKAAIVAVPGLENLPMDVRASGNAVTLYGTADSEEQRLRAEKAAARVPGVVSVNNKLLLVRGS